MLDLNHIMEFDHVIEIKEDGSVVDRPEIYAPEYFNDELQDDGWTNFAYGYTGQYGVATPMHNSEFIGGRLARDILDTPGIYVAVVCYWDTEEDDDDTSEGWTVARMRD